MHVYPIKSSEVESKLYQDVFEILQRFNGPIKFHSSETDVSLIDDEIDERPFKADDFNKQVRELSIDIPQYSTYHSYKRPVYPKIIRSAKWSALFSKCKDYRKKNRLDETDWVVLLTNIANENNWFAAGEPSGLKNFFIHTDQWEFFIPCDSRFPIAYEVMVTLLHSLMFENYDDMFPKLHLTPKGCVNDFCKQKKDIIFKLRTADICMDCQQIIYSKKIDPLIVDQIFKTIEDIRKQMLFRERYKITLQPSRISIRGPMQRIFFTDLGNVELKLTPLERIVYLLFLEHSEGLHLDQLYDHKPWLQVTYSSISNGILADRENSIDQLVNRVENSINEKLARIKKKIEQLAGSELSTNYIIDGNRGEPKSIKLDRNLVTYEPQWREN